MGFVLVDSINVMFFFLILLLLLLLLFVTDGRFFELWLLAMGDRLLSGRLEDI